MNADIKSGSVGMVDKGSFSFSSGLVALAAVVIIFWGLRSLAFILAPLLTAMVITITILPLPGWLASKGMRSTVALILTILVVVAVLALTCFVIVASIGQLTSVLPSYTDSLGQEMPIDEETSSSLTSAAESLSGAIVVAAGKFVGQVFVILFIFAFMLSAALALRNTSADAFGIDATHVDSVQDFTMEVRQYMTLLTVINLLVAAGDTLFLTVIGIDFALLWGILAFFMGFIPSIGWWISLIPPFLIAWSQYGIDVALLVLVAYVVINGGVQNIVQPRLMGKGLSISPLVVFVSVIVWATILGGWGALIAVPLTMLVMKILESNEGTRWIASLMRIGSEHESGEDKQAAQRLKGVADKLRGSLPSGAKNGQESPPPEDQP